MELNALGKGHLYTSDVMYPGWRARVDGEDVKIEKWENLFRSVPVSAGNHKIEFYYDVSRYQRFGVAAAVVAAIGFILCMMPRKKEAYAA